MRQKGPFQYDDLIDLDERLLAHAEWVRPMRTVGRLDDVVGLRHDVDNTFEACVDLAKWEADRQYYATYFILHDSPYWYDRDLREGLDIIASHGHEIGLHVNAVAVALEQGGDPHTIVGAALDRLRGWGHDVVGVAGHGDPLCYAYEFVNDEIFEECRRPEMGDATRTLHGRHTVTIEPRPLADFGLEYDSYRVGTRALYLSDSGGAWNAPGFDVIADRFPSAAGQLHVLMHPCWWVEAFAGVRV